MRSFYQFLMTYRQPNQRDERSELANWAYSDHDFPRQSKEYNELSNYLEWNSPFPNALITFDKLWEIYELTSN